jgi:hypothetical protein
MEHLIVTILKYALFELFLFSLLRPGGKEAEHI